MIFEVLVILLVVYSMFLIAQGFAEGKTVTKVNMAQDITLMAQTLASISGDALVYYPHNVSEYTFAADGQSLTVFAKVDPPLRHAIRNLQLPEGYALRGLIEEKERLCLEKKGRVLTVRECASNEP